MSGRDLGAIRKRADEATPGPWGTPTQPNAVRALPMRPALTLAAFRRNEDAAFVAHAREDVPALLDALEGALARERRIRAAAVRALTDEATGDDAVNPMDEAEAEATLETWERILARGEGESSCG